MESAPGGCSTASRRAFLRTERCVFQDGADNAASPTIHGDIGDRGVSPEPRGRDGRVERLRGGACRVQKPSSRGLDRVCQHLHLASSGDASSQGSRMAVAGRRTSNLVSRACIQAAPDPSDRIILTSFSCHWREALSAFLFSSQVMCSEVSGLMITIESGHVRSREPGAMAAVHPLRTSQLIEIASR